MTIAFRSLWRSPILHAVLALGSIGLRPGLAVEIPLDTLVPSRIGYVDLQRVFDTYPEKSFAEGDLLREIERRKRELGRRQTEINLLNQQVLADQAALADARKGLSVRVPANAVPEPEPAVASAPAAAAPRTSTGTAKTPIEDYPMEDPLAGLPGHGAAVPAAEATSNAPKLPGMKDKDGTRTLLDSLAQNATGPVLLSPEATAALEKRLGDNQQRLDRATVEFKTFRGNAVADMKALQTQKTYGVMSRIYATLQVLARDEGVMVVMDKAYVLYGEDAVDLSEKLIERLQGEQQG